MSQQAGDKGQRVIPHGERSSIVLTRGMLLCYKEIGMVQSHQDHDQSTQGVDSL